jgi:hypothetical protein
MKHNGTEGRGKLGTEANRMRKERSADFEGRIIFGEEKSSLRESLGVLRNGQ